MPLGTHYVFDTLALESQHPGEHSAIKSFIICCHPTEPRPFESVNNSNRSSIDNATLVKANYCCWKDSHCIDLSLRCPWVVGSFLRDSRGERSQHLDGKSELALTMDS